MISYTSFTFFILFFGITYLLYVLCPTKAKWVVLLVGSYVFYFFSSKGHVITLIAATLIVWGAGLWIDKLDNTFKEKRKGLERAEKKALKAKYAKYKSLVMWAGIILTMGMLITCKYANFFIDTFNGIFDTAIGRSNIVQPLGISFYTLMAVSYLADVHSGKYKAQKNPFRVGLYLAFFLTIVEGPFARYDQFGTQLNNRERFKASDFVYGAQRVVWGLFKKVVVADRAAELVDIVFDNSRSYSGVIIVAAILLYTLQLYCEFSGVMDIVSGLGETMGLKLPENFARPFFAKGINEFWQRWHITLGAWLRDYIFYPISFSKTFMNASKKARSKFSPYYANLVPTAVALFFVWFGNGFWHGSGWKYIVYGLYYYVLMMIGMFMEPLFRKICDKAKINRQSKGFGIFQMVRTFFIVNIGMLIFRADTLKQASEMVTSIFTNPNFEALRPGAKNGLGLDLYDYLILVIGTLIVFVVGLIQEKGVDIRARIAKLPFALKFVMFIAAVMIIIVFGAYGEGYGKVDLIYANF
ncbi:MAG: MBOAT family protein [Eubacterium sp.]|nr:MBOAT family protein [Eubacterium sp.]MBQ8980971.1 MBOAT family protein [Eubacterium sp.]MBR2279171.1 MBOAT family protein [Eubacterium sp.]